MVHHLAKVVPGRTHAVEEAPAQRKASAEFKSFTAVADGRLETLQQLGRGSSATVTQCAWSSPQGGRQMVAMKKIRTELLQNPQEVMSFMSEVRLLKRLDHRYIVEFYGCGWQEPGDTDSAYGQQLQSGHELYFLQEYMAGGSLHQMVLRTMTSQVGKQVYSDADAFRWSLQIALALQHCHSLSPKLMHRDIKLENILLTSSKPAEADAKLADFGLARKVQGGDMGSGPKLSQIPEILAPCTGAEMLASFVRSGSDELEQQLTTSMAQRDPAEADGAGATPPKQHFTAKTGSLGYMAPEVLKGRPYSEAADVFSFGICLYNLFHRDVPTLHVVLNGGAEDLEVYAHNVANGFRPPMKPHVPIEVRYLIERCWKGLPELRLTMSEVVAELQRLQLPEKLPNVRSQAQGGGSKSPGCCTIM